MNRARPLSDEPRWYEDAVIYELHVRAFRDSDGDGIGDFCGLVEKLDYLRELGVTAVWLLPFYVSPLRDDGYDIADYREVHPSYGSLDDFRVFLEAAHERSIRVITELVVNHTSDQHPWFQRARRAPRGSPERDFYVWSDDPDRYSEARVIFRDYEPSNWTWDPVAEQYFWHRFYHHQPDLNFENPRVREELFDVVDYWLGMGVDGMRLDAVPYLFEREGTNCENLPETHTFLKELRARVDEKFDQRMLLAEANQWPEDAAEYFGDGDECHMCFHFPIMPRLFMSLRMEDRFPIVDILQQTPEIPEACQWAMFLRNHDELTLEMVTDEERDYMYRVYAREEEARINLGIRRRLAPLLKNHRRKIELMNSLLFALPGTPVVYYGDEIGMGDNVYLGDRQGMRTPMQWSGDRNAGFSDANPQKLYLPVVLDPEYHYESVNVEAQHGNQSSLLWWMRRLIRLRKQHRAFGRGDLEWLTPDNERILAFVRRWEDEAILVVANLSRFVQHVSLDLAAWSGQQPVELFGRTEFPEIDGDPYFLTLGPHAFYWFELAAEPARPLGAGEPAAGELVRDEEAETLPVLGVQESWDEIFREPRRNELERVLADWVRARRWFAGKGSVVRSARIERSFRAGPDEADRWEAVFLTFEYAREGSETYFVPLALLQGEDADRLLDERADGAVVRVHGPRGEGVLADAAESPGFRRDLLGLATGRRRTATDAGDVWGVAPAMPPEELPDPDEDLPVSIGGREQSNTSLVYGERWIAKLFRRLEPGVNLDREVGEFLTERGFPHAPDVVGAVEFQPPDELPATLAVVHEYVPHAADAWEHTVHAVERYLERALTSEAEPARFPMPERRLLGGGDGGVPDDVFELFGPSLEETSLLGRRTAELHRTLASADRDEAFAPEPFTTLYQRSLYQSMRNLLGRTFRRVERIRWRLPDGVREEADRVLGTREVVLRQFRRILGRRLDAVRIRVHGDYHLGQVLHTGKDFVIIDFEGEPDRPLGERRLKRSPLRDVAGMIRSFDYAAHAALFAMADRDVVDEPVGSLEPWARLWHRWVSAVFAAAYLDEVAGSDLLPDDPTDRETLLEVYLIEKALYELGYEVDNRPDWVRIPVHGILRLLEPEADALPAEDDGTGPAASEATEEAPPGEAEPGELEGEPREHRPGGRGEVREESGAGARPGPGEEA